MSANASENVSRPSTSPPRQRQPSMIFTLPQLPTFESTWDFSQFRSQSPEISRTPSPACKTLPAVSPSKFINTTKEDYSPTRSTKSEKKMCFRAPPPSPKFEPVQAMNDKALSEVCAYASLALSIENSSTELSAVPGLTDSFFSTNYSSDEQDTDLGEDDAYHASANRAWDTYYNSTSPAKVQEHQDEVMEQSYILPSAESCYALGFGKLGCPSTPSPVKKKSPIRRAPTNHTQRPSPLHTRIAPSPAPVNTAATARPSFQVRRKDSGRSQRSTRTLTQQRFNNKPSEHPLCRTTTVSRPRPKHEASLSFKQALNSIPPPPALPAKFDSVRGTKSPPIDYTPPYLSLFPMSSRHSTPNGEVPPFPMPTRRAPRPVTAPCVGSTSNLALGIQASTTVLGSAGGAIVVEKSVWEEDSDEEEQEPPKGKWHIRNLSGESKGSVRRREKEKWGKRSASDVVKGLFGLHH